MPTLRCMDKLLLDTRYRLDGLLDGGFSLGDLLQGKGGLLFTACLGGQRRLPIATSAFPHFICALVLIYRVGERLLYDWMAFNIPPPNE